MRHTSLHLHTFVAACLLVKNTHNSIVINDNRIKPEENSKRDYAQAFKGNRVFYMLKKKYKRLVGLTQAYGHFVHSPFSSIINKRWHIVIYGEFLYFFFLCHLTLEVETFIQKKLAIYSSRSETGFRQVQHCIGERTRIGCSNPCMHHKRLGHMAGGGGVGVAAPPPPRIFQIANFRGKKKIK